MEIVGRITAQATIKTVGEQRQVVEFTVVTNEQYRNTAGEKVEVINFYRCGYWIGTKIAHYLSKGALVQVTGRLHASAWLNREGEPRATLNFHVNNIRLLTKSRLGEQEILGLATDQIARTEVGNDSRHKARQRGKTTDQQKDDLPF